MFLHSVKSMYRSSGELLRKSLHSTPRARSTSCMVRASPAARAVRRSQMISIVRGLSWSKQRLRSAAMTLARLIPPKGPWLQTLSRTMSACQMSVGNGAQASYFRRHWRRVCGTIRGSCFAFAAAPASAGQTGPGSLCGEIRRRRNWKIQSQNQSDCGATRPLNRIRPSKFVSLSVFMMTRVSVPVVNQRIWPGAEKAAVPIKVKF